MNENTVLTVDEDMSGSLRALAMTILGSLCVIFIAMTFGVNSFIEWTLL